MMTPRKKSSFASIVVLALLVLVAASGICQGWWPNGWSDWGFGSGWFPRSPDLEKLPHYALFPPVYYSHPVPRTYGYSPFASLPELTTVLEVRSPQPLMVSNPYVASPRGAASLEMPTPGGPLIVKNPFVGQAADAMGDSKRLAGE